jgi:VWFA-related protein
MRAGRPALAVFVIATWGLTPVSTGGVRLQADATEPITVDVVVTDAKLRLVQNLGPTDFEVVDSGEARLVAGVRQQSGDSRVLAIFLDEYHVAAGGGTTRARAALAQFVRTQLRDGDTVAIMKPLDPLSGITLTKDRDTILQAIATFEGRRGDYSPRSKFEENFISRDPRTADVSRAQVVTSALQALAARLGEQGHGRKALILVSEGFAPSTSPAIYLAANRHRVAIYSVDPSIDTGPDEQTLRILSEQTGGYWSINQQDLAPAINQSVADLDRYYVLTYQPASGADGKFHPVQVRVKRPGSQTRARAGYWAANPAPVAAKSAGRGTMLALPFRPAHSSPYIQPWIGMSRGGDGLTRVTVTWEPGVAPPRNQRVASVTVKAVAADGGVLFQHRYGAGDTGRAAFDAPPGYIALEMAIQSSTGAALDLDYRGLAVPDLQAKKPTIATPQFLRTRTARRFAEVSANANALPVASRTFSRAERLLVRVPVYGPDNSTPTLTATLLNRRGLPMRELQRVPAALPAGLVQFDLPLSSLAPDEYRVELVAANDRGPREEARELVVFRVTN